MAKVPRRIDIVLSICNNSIIINKYISTKINSNNNTVIQFE